MKPPTRLLPILLLALLASCTTTPNTADISHSTTGSTWRRDPGQPTATQLINDLAAVSKSHAGMVGHSTPEMLHYEVHFYTPDQQLAASAIVITQDMPDGTVHLKVNSHTFTTAGTDYTHRHDDALALRCRQLFSEQKRAQAGSTSR